MSTDETKTKQCDNEKCNTTIAKSEAKCPACGETQLDDEDIRVVERANQILEKRKKAAVVPPVVQPQPTTATSRFAKLRALRKK